MAAVLRRPSPARLRQLERPARLAALMGGAKGLLIDIDGVLVQQGRAIAGAPEGLAEVARRGLPYRLATNTSLVSRATLARRAAALGLAVDPDRIVSALSASAALAARRFPGRPLFVLCSGDARREFAGQHLLRADEADALAADPGGCAAVIVGDSPEALTWANLNRAFRLVRAGARLVAMHRNPWWLTPAGPTIDAGAFVVGLEFATRRRALLAGKPSRTFFAEAVRALGVPAADVVMVGDDLRSDVAGARRAGLRTVWVRSGRHGPDDLALAASRGDPPPDAAAPDFAAVVAALVAGPGPRRPE